MANMVTASREVVGDQDHWGTWFGGSVSAVFAVHLEHDPKRVPEREDLRKIPAQVRS